MSNLLPVAARIPIPVTLLGIIGVIIAIVVALGVCWFVGVMIGVALGKLLGMEQDGAAAAGGVGGIAGLVIGIAIVYFEWQFMPATDVIGIPADIIVCFAVGAVGAVLVAKAAGV